MEQITFDLPEPLLANIQELVTKGEFGSVGDYIVMLIRADRKRRAVRNIEAMVAEAYASGPAVEATPAYWKELERDLDEYLAKESVKA